MGDDESLGPPTAATLVAGVEPTQREMEQISPVSGVSSFEVPTIRMDVDNTIQFLDR